jgi:phosphoribosylformimino-5-aminoimidazole carboxamide ribotide isomerase
MLIIPSIEIYDGKCVRLIDGSFSNRRVYLNSPVELASLYVEYGFPLLHIVDLEGAQFGQVKNWKTLESILAIEGANIQFGGGVRSKEEIEKLLHMGIRRAVLGSIAVTLPSLVKRWIAEIGAKRIVIAVDVRNGKIAHSGWLEEIEQSPTVFMMELKSNGASSFIYTDINREAAHDGPNLDLYTELRSFFKDVDLIASGGVRNIKDVQALKESGVSGIIIGRALLEKTIHPNELRPFLEKG